MQVTAKLEGKLAEDFACLVAATKSPKAALVRIALEQLIAKACHENEGIRERFEQERARRAWTQRQHLRVVK